MSDITYWIWYAIRCGVGNGYGAKLLERFDGNVAAIYEADPDELMSVSNIDKSLLTRLTDRNLQKANEIKEICSVQHIRILSPESEDYPKRLLSLYNYPFVLYAKGRIEKLSERPCVAVVGTRNMTGYGKDAAFDLVRGLCGYGFVIVSGAAYGIDTMANRTAAFFGGDTIAVLGSGIDVPYPPVNRPLLEQIAEHGLVLSEYMPGTPPVGTNFPIRNRIISGLSDAVLVVEAGEKSGSLITARYAFQQNKRVFAVPGSIYDSNSRGTNLLIRDGANVCTCAEDIVDALSDEFLIDRVDSIVSDEKYLRYEMRMQKRLSADAEAVHSGRKTVQVTHFGTNAVRESRPIPQNNAAKPSASMPTNAAKPSPNMPTNAAKPSPNMPTDAAKPSPNMPTDAANHSASQNGMTSGQTTVSQHIGSFLKMKDFGKRLTSKSGKRSENGKAASQTVSGKAAVQTASEKAAVQTNFEKTASQTVSGKAASQTASGKAAVQTDFEKAASKNGSDESSGHIMTAEQQALLDSMPHNVAVAPDQLVTETMSASEIISLLTVLELFGKVEAVPGGLYRRI